jgi:hypothetical protein
MREYLCCCYKCSGQHGDPDRCGRNADEQFSLGIYAGMWCDDCFMQCSGYRQESASAFDSDDAGETYELAD